LSQQELYNSLKVISSYHRKGGVGKTFLASTIAYMLANGGPEKKGKKKRVLVLDYDAQQDTSKAFLKMEPIPGDDEYAAPRHPEFGEIDGQVTTLVLIFYLIYRFTNIQLHSRTLMFSPPKEMSIEFYRLVTTKIN
jgi:cellulose biosynthesis protein BcsQ